MATAALCGVPFFSGFFSKDEIIDNADHNDYTVFFIIGLIGAFDDRRVHDASHVPDVLRQTARRCGRRTPRRRTRRGARAGARGRTTVAASHDAHAPDHQIPAIAQPDHHAQPDDHGAHAGAARVAVADHRAAGDPGVVRLVRRLPQRAGVAVQHREVHGVGRAARCARVRSRGDGRPGRGDRHTGHGAGRDPRGRAERGARRDEGEEAEHAATGCGFEVPVDSVCFAPSLSHAEFKWPKALPSILLVALGGFASLWICIGIFSRERFFAQGPHHRASPRPAGATTSSSTSTTSITSTRR